MDALKQYARGNLIPPTLAGIRRAILGRKKGFSWTVWGGEIHTCSERAERRYPHQIVV